LTYLAAISCGFEAAPTSDAESKTARELRRYMTGESHGQCRETSIAK
jgi:hypothetical protein